MRVLKAVAWVAAIALLAALIGMQYLRSSLPQLSGVVAVPGLALPVQIVRDSDGVPHVYAPTLEAANFALGYAHAQDRLWQMEMNRRIAAGRLAEVFGEKGLDTDRFLRTLGVRRHAQATFARLDARTRAVFRAYADGVNAFLAGRRGPLPPEFLLTGVSPEPWEPADSLAWLKMMAWDLSDGWRNPMFRLKLAERLTPRQIEQLLPPYPGDPPRVVPDLKHLYTGLSGPAGAILARAPQPEPEGMGSNNWVVSGARSASGKPLLANDPHLSLTAPALWYFAHLETPDTRVIGATLPGVPMVVLGRNARIAWGFTNTGSDVQDLYLERLDASNPDRYLTPDGYRRFEIVDELIRVKGGDPLRLRVRLSRHGPVISDVYADARRHAPAEHVLAFAWTALTDDDLTGQALVKVAGARDWESFLEAMHDFHSPQQNVVYADVDGHIGFVAPARVPLRRKDNELKGLVPLPGWDARYDWLGFIPFDELPRRFDPPEGWLASANEKIVGPDYPHWITGQWQPPFRAKRIRALLEARDRHDAASFRAMQADVRSGYLAEVLPLLLAHPPASQRAARAHALLRAWDARMEAGRPEPLIATAWTRALTRAVYADELGEMFPKHWLERPLFMLDVLRNSRGAGLWCDDVATMARETCAERIGLALEQALDELTQRHGADLRRWRWDEAHTAVSEHRPLSSRPGLARFFELRVPTPGDTWSLNVGRVSIAHPTEPFSSRHAASLRAIYDLADPDASVWIHSTGQSGNPFSPLYGSLNADWARVEYRSMSMRREDIERRTLGRLSLQPAGAPARTGTPPPPPPR